MAVTITEILAEMVDFASVAVPDWLYYVGAIIIMGLAVAFLRRLVLRGR